MSTIEITVLFPVLAALAIAIGSPVRMTALAGAFLTLAGAAISAAKLSLSVEGQFQLDTSHTLLKVAWLPEVNLAFGVDGVSIVMMILTALVLFAAIWNAPADSHPGKFFYIACLLIGAGTMGAFCTTDLFFLYVFHALALILMIKMIATFGSNDNRKQQALKFGIFSGTGSIFLLIGLIMMVRGLGSESLDISELIGRGRDLETGISIGDQGMIYLFLLIAFTIFAALSPFQSGARTAFCSAPKSGAMLHIAVLKSFGIYGLIRVAIPILPHGASDMTGLMLLLSAASIIGVGMLAIRQKDNSQMPAYISVMFSGYAFLGIASGTRTGMIGVVLLLFSHGLCIALLIALSGQSAGRSRVLSKLVVIAAIGLPGFAVFPAQLLIFFGAFESYSGNTAPGFLQWIAMLAIGGLVIFAICLCRNFDGTERRTPIEEFGTALILLTPLIVVGFIPDLALRFIRAATEGISLFGAA